VRYSARPWVAGELRNLGTFDTLDEAKAARDDARATVSTGRQVLDARTSKLTVGDFAADYLAGNAPRWAYGTQLSKASSWAALAPAFAAVPVVALRPSHVADWLAAQTVARGTTLNRLVVLRAVLDRAARDLGIPNAAKLVEVAHEPVAPPPSASQKFAMTAATARALVAAFDERYRLVALLMLGLGVRSGEARGLTLDHVDLGTGEVRIDRQLVRVKVGDTPPRVDLLTDSLGLGPPKSRRSYRTLNADADLLAAIREHVAAYGTGALGLLVTNRSGRPLHDTTWCKAVDAAVAKARLAGAVDLDDLTGHDLRHTRASWSLADGATLAKVAAELGHTTRTLHDFYLHAEKAGDAELAGKAMARLREPVEVVEVVEAVPAAARPARPRRGAGVGHAHGARRKARKSTR
jgi:integrase